MFIQVGALFVALKTPTELSLVKSAVNGMSGGKVT
jgi:hypothetical protein